MRNSMLVSSVAGSILTGCSKLLNRPLLHDNDDLVSKTIHLLVCSIFTDCYISMALCQGKLNLVNIKVANITG